MKLIFPSTFLALALIQAPKTSHAFAPLSSSHSQAQLRKQHHNNRISTHLHMVGFKDPREEETADAMKSIRRLEYETTKVKKWLVELMRSEEEETKTPAAAAAADSDDIGLFGGGGTTATSSTTNNLPSYKPSLRSDLGKTVLLTGTYHPALLRVLNNNDFGSRETIGGGESGDLIPNFQFDKIIVSVKGEEDAKEVKKRLVSRETRYSGLLNKLVIESEDTLLPAKERMDGVSSWIVNLQYAETAGMLPKVAELAKNCVDLKNIIVIVEGVNSMTSAVDGWDSLLESGGNFQSTLLAVGELYDQGTEGKFYHIGNFMSGESSIELSNSDANAPKMLRDDAYVTLANLLALKCSANKALGTYEYSPSTMEMISSGIEETKTKVLKDGELVAEENPEEDEWKRVKYANRIVRAMRATGFSRLAELDVMLEKGVDGYIEFLNAPPKPATRGGEGEKKDKWDEIDEKIMADLDAKLAETEAKRKAEEEQQYNEDINSMARDWALRQYTLKSLNNEVDDMTEREFVQSVWEEALEEGKKLYETIHSKEYRREMERKRRSASEFIYQGMDEREKRKRELILEKVKNQYLESYAGDLEVGEDDLEESLAVDE